MTDMDPKLWLNELSFHCHRNAAAGGLVKVVITVSLVAIDRASVPDPEPDQ